MCLIPTNNHFHKIITDTDIPITHLENVNNIECQSPVIHKETEIQ